MVSRNRPIIPLKLPLFNLVLSHFTVMLCTFSFFEDSNFERTGRLHSSIPLIMIVGEMFRWGISKYVFDLNANTKEFSLSNSRQAAAKNESLIPKVIKAYKLCMLLAVFVAVYVIACILMGASYHNKYEETLALAILLTALSILPIGLFLGPSKTIQYLFYDSFELLSYFDVWQLELLQYNAFGALLGAWAGSIVSPLDWDRPWQQYPIPNVVGAVLGFAFCNVRTFLTSIIQISERMIDFTVIPDTKKTI